MSVVGIDPMFAEKRQNHSMASILHKKMVEAHFIFLLCAEKFQQKRRKIEMNYLKYTLFMLALVISFSLTATAQTKEEEEKKIPKPNPPVVIVYPDKKSDEKRREEEKRGNKPQILLFD